MGSNSEWPVFAVETNVLHQALHVEVAPAAVPAAPSSIRAWIAPADVLQQSASSEEAEGAPDAPGAANGLLDSDSDDGVDLNLLRDDFGDSSMEESTGGDSEIGSDEEDEEDEEDLLPSERKSRKLEHSRRVLHMPCLLCLQQCTAGRCC